jgi:hypothetical protein
MPSAWQASTNPTSIPRSSAKLFLVDMDALSQFHLQIQVMTITSFENRILCQVQSLHSRFTALLTFCPSPFPIRIQCPNTEVPPFTSKVFRLPGPHQNDEPIACESVPTPALSQSVHENRVRHRMSGSFKGLIPGHVVHVKSLVCCNIPFSPLGP